MGLSTQPPTYLPPLSPAGLPRCPLPSHLSAVPLSLYVSPSLPPSLPLSLSFFHSRLPESRPPPASFPIVLSASEGAEGSACCSSLRNIPSASERSEGAPSEASPPLRRGGGGAALCISPLHSMSPLSNPPALRLPLLRSLLPRCSPRLARQDLFFASVSLSLSLSLVRFRSRRSPSKLDCMQARWSGREEGGVGGRGRRGREGDRTGEREEGRGEGGGRQRG